MYRALSRHLSALCCLLLRMVLLCHHVLPSLLKGLRLTFPASAMPPHHHMPCALVPRGSSVLGWTLYLGLGCRSETELRYLRLGHSVTPSCHLHTPLLAWGVHDGEIEL